MSSTRTIHATTVARMSNGFESEPEGEVSPRERLGRHHEVHHQCLEVGPVAQRVEG